MNPSPLDYKLAEVRRQDIMKQVEQNRLARQNNPTHNTFATIKNRVSSALARGAAQGSATSEGLGEGIAVS